MNQGGYESNAPELFHYETDSQRLRIRNWDGSSAKTCG